MTSSPVFLPRQFALDVNLHGSVVQQLRSPERDLGVLPLQTYRRRQTTGGQILLPDGERVVVFDRTRTIPDDVSTALWTSSGHFPSSFDDCTTTAAKWLKPRASRDLGVAQPQAVRDSWRGQFTFVEEEEGADGRVSPGLRPPQVGAVYAALAHWKIGTEPATIVMPTGTGKTETMLTLLVSQRLERLLVVVPNDALRTQLGEKFLTLGLLHTLGTLGPQAQFPVVCRLKKRPKTPEQVDELFLPSNVVVTTMDILSGCGEDVLARMVEYCSHLFIDEAHHTPARTWEAVKRAFDRKIVLQFTATPFRNDRRHVDGQTIFNYPLRKAQQEGYFKPITFEHVWEFDPQVADQAIAAKAVAALARDVGNGLDHLVMARAKSIGRAEEVLSAYGTYPEWHPVLIHSGLSGQEQRDALAALRRRASRIVVCVDMFGEGFDLPELKIAALHDAHKSLAVTLQFTGRFTRSKRALGDATVVANLAEPSVQGALKDLYAENADWNLLLRELSAGATETQYRLSAFFKDFQSPPRQVPLQNITPKMSTVVYRTTCQDWDPAGIEKAMADEVLLEAPAVHSKSRLAVFVTEDRAPVDWGNVRDLQEIAWHLYLVHWDAERRLLFINSTVGNTMHEELARAVCGDDAALVKGETVFRTLHGINRLTLTNLGLNHALGRAVRFTMFMGSDILAGLAEAQKLNKTKSNIFGFGYRNADRASAGCSAKGKLWSYQIAASLPEWLDWCHTTGDKLLDDTIDIDAILRNVVKYEPLDGRPDGVPLAVEWSPEVLRRPEDSILFEVNGDRAPLHEVGLVVVNPSDSGPIRFKVVTEKQEAEYEMEFDGGRISYLPVKGTVQVISARKSLDLDTWFQKENPTVYLNDGNGRALIQYNLLAKLIPVDAPYDRSRIQVWDWTGTDITRESQGLTRDPLTVQYRVVQEVKSQGFEVVVDDDNPGEAADVVALRSNDDTLTVHLYHCKFSGQPSPGARVKDLYEVCGQAQKSVHWRESPGVSALLRHLRQREVQRQRKYGVTRFEVGDLVKLRELERKSPYLALDFHVFVVQPGVSQGSVSPEQLDLLATTELYLKESYELPFHVIASP